MTVELNPNLTFNLTELDGGGFDSTLPNGTPQGGGSLQTIFTDDFASGDLSKTQNGFTWGSSVSTAVTANNPNTGANSLEFIYVQKVTSDEAWSEQNFDLGALYKEVEVTFNWYFPDGTEPYGTDPWYHESGTGSSNNKVIRLWPSDPDKSLETGGINSYASTEKTGFEYYVGTSGASRLVSTWDGGGGMGPYGINRVDDDFFTPGTDQGTWIETKLHFKFPSAVGANDGFNRAYRNDVLVVDNPTDMYSATAGADHGWRYGYLLGYQNYSRANDMKMHLDKIVFRGVLL